MTKENLLLDYGGLIVNYDFNEKTLFRAHNLFLDYINSFNGNLINLQNLSKAHNKAIRAYLETRQKDNSEWHLDKIIGLMLSDLGINVPVSEVSEIYKLKDHDSKPFPNSKQILVDLSKTHKLGIISNLPHNSLIYELRKEEMLNLFDPIVISYQVGFRKPHPAIYQEAMRRANAKPERCIFVSHDEPEVKGAEAVGIRGILVKSLEEVIGIL